MKLRRGRSRCGCVPGVCVHGVVLPAGYLLIAVGMGMQKVPAFLKMLPLLFWEIACAGIRN
jgi:hypothetical protein